MAEAKANSRSHRSDACAFRSWKTIRVHGNKPQVRQPGQVLLPPGIRNGHSIL